MTTWEVRQGDCVAVMALMQPSCIDAIILDPPYGLSDPPPIEDVLRAWLAGKPYVHTKRGFMGNGWDAFVPGPEMFREAFRVAKPGAHMAVFAGTRTQDAMGMSIRLAGWEIRDTIMWVYGSGMPKSLNVGKAMSKAAMEEATDWEGWGTTLKPAYEPIIIARKPLVGTVVENVATHGTGALNIDACRIPVAADDEIFAKNPHTKGGFGHADSQVFGDGAGVKTAYDPSKGRWPANIIFDSDAGALLDEQSGYQKDGIAVQRNGGGQVIGGVECRTGAGSNPIAREDVGFGSGGGASRFFYCAKAARNERNAGVSGVNLHPTVKPISLMRYLVRMLTPPGGMVLDAFVGSGTTGCATVLEGFDFLGIEQDPEHVITARERIAYWLRTTQRPVKAGKRKRAVEPKAVHAEPAVDALQAPEW